MTRARLDRLFHLGLALKGLQALAEALGALALWLVPTPALVALVRALTQQELAEDPQDRIARFLLTSAQALSIPTLHVYALFLALHGAVKLALVLGLWRDWAPARPLAMTALALFILWQLHRFALTHAPLLLVMSAFDLLLIALIHAEGRRR